MKMQDAKALDNFDRLRQHLKDGSFDGTARDKAARVQRLRTLRDEAGHTYDVIACIAGRGFKVCREDIPLPARVKE